ncbi:MAG: leucine-rich repeat protein, partial [Bacteroidales bacterium]|nr:leucine-rich repeat protein [Bacteroidales bacterium]
MRRLVLLLLCFHVFFAWAGQYDDFVVNGIGYKIISQNPNRVKVNNNVNNSWLDNWSDMSLYVRTVSVAYMGVAVIPDTVEFNGQKYLVSEIGVASFRNSNVTEVHLPSSVHKINYFAFQNCHNLRKVYFPEGLDTISLYAFQHCDSLEDILLPNSLLYVGGAAFYDCPSVKQLNIGTELIYMAEDAFVLANNLQRISYNARNCHTEYLGNFDYPRNIGFSSDAYCRLDIGDSVQIIPENLFFRDNGLRGKVIIPSSVKYIAQSAFYRTGIDTLVFSMGLDSIGESAFQDCNNISVPIVLPSSLKRVGEDAFYGRYNYTSPIVLPDGIEYIADNAFNNGAMIGKITVPASVRYIGEESLPYDTLIIESDSIVLGRWAIDYDGVVYINSLNPPRLEPGLCSVPVYEGVDTICPFPEMPDFCWEEDHLSYWEDVDCQKSIDYGDDLYIFIPCGARSIYCQASPGWQYLCQKSDKNAQDFYDDYGYEGYSVDHVEDFRILEKGYRHEETIQVCGGYAWGSMGYITTSDVYTQTFTASDGCDSVVTLNLTILPAIHDVESDTACDRYTWHGNTYTTSGTYVYEYSNGTCPCADTLHLTINTCVVPPVITPAAGTYFEAQTVTLTTPTTGASIYYTLDGSEPSANSMLYTAPFTVNATTTVKAVAISGTSVSDVSAATYTIPTNVPDVATFKAQTSTTELFKINSDLTVIYQSEDRQKTFVQDATAAIYIYGTTREYHAGDVISGGVFGRYSVYHDMRELVPQGTDQWPAGMTGTPVEPIVVTLAQLQADYDTYESKLVRVEDVIFTQNMTFNTYSASNANISQGDITSDFQIRNEFKTLSTTVAAGDVADVTGLVMRYGNIIQIVPCSNGDIVFAALPTITTNNVSNISDFAATCGGNVTSDGGAAVTARGVCWSTNHNPTIADAHTIDGVDTGSFTSSLTGLASNTTYYVRAYATNSVGTAYGDEVSFTTERSSCTLTFDMHDSYGDGWNGNAIRIHNNGTIRDVTLLSGSEGTAAVTVYDGHTELEWLKDLWSEECSFSVTGPCLYFSGEALENGVLYSTELHCGSNGIVAVPSFTYWLEDTCNSVIVHFENNSSNAEFTTWDFGDGTTSDVFSPNHIYSADGTYSVTLSVSNSSCENGHHNFTNVITVVVPKPTVVLFDTVIFSSALPLTWHGQEFTEADYRTTVLQSVKGCDSVVTNISVKISLDGDALPCPGYETVADHEGNIYNTVQIGNQCWTKENMRCTTSPRGHLTRAGNLLIPYSALYYNDVSSSIPLTKRGLLYNWAGAMDTTATEIIAESFVGRRGICPEGWHVPSDSDWIQLSNYVSGKSQYLCDAGIAKALASQMYWNSINEDLYQYGPPGRESYMNNATGFSAIPTGYAGLTSLESGNVAYFWSSTGSPDAYALSYMILGYYSGVFMNVSHEGMRLAVRCVLGCSEPSTVVTSNVTNINASMATCGGNVTSDGGSPVTARGVCWSTAHNPTVNDSHTSDGTGLGVFTSSITGLYLNTTYYVRAYSVNSAGITYGDEVSFIMSTSPFVCGTSTVTDYDGNLYNTVQIGNQCWMRENLRTTHYSDGTAISELAEGYNTVENNIYYFNVSSSGFPLEERGYLYNWLAAMHRANSSNTNPSGIQGICPTGWHLPSTLEWAQLSDYLSTQNDYVCTYQNEKMIAKALASTSGWLDDTNPLGCEVGHNQSANNASGFSAIPVGIRANSSYYSAAGAEAGFWSSTSEEYSANVISIRNYNGRLFFSGDYPSNGYSVRCLVGGGANMPSVITAPISEIDVHSAVGGGNVTDDGGASVTARGLCWSICQNPTLNDSHTVDSIGAGAFISAVSGLAPNTTYFVRAYATNCMGTSYGDEVSFTTLVSSSNDTHPCQSEPTVTDYDGNVYNTVQIGDQCWMKENLRVTHYENGVEIPAGTTSSENVAYRYCPNNDSNNVATYGYLYNWAAVMNGAGSSDSIPSNVQGVCPTGWHLPSDAEWTQLADYVGHISKLLASTDGWNSTDNSCAIGNGQSENNATGFGALPAGIGLSNHYFGSRACYWSSTEYNSYISKTFELSYNQTFIEQERWWTYYGCSVRCLQDIGCLPNTSEFADTACEQYVWGDSVYVQSGVYTQTFTNVNGCDSVVTIHLTVNTSVSEVVYAATDSVYIWNGQTCTESGNYTQVFTNVAGCDSVVTLHLTVTSYSHDCDAQSCPGVETVTDYDGNVYNTVKIGSQCWMKEDLRTTHYTDGTEISAANPEEMVYTPSYFDCGIPYCSGCGNSSNYGYLYNWYAVMNGASSSNANPSGVQGICPTGWHVPSDAEWTQLTDYVASIPAYVFGSDSNNIAKALASSTPYWVSGGNSCSPGNARDWNNITGFSAVPMGRCYRSCANSGFEANYWSSTLYDYRVWSRVISSDNPKIQRSYMGEYYGYSVRCVWDNSVAVDVEVTTEGISELTVNSATGGGTVTPNCNYAISERGVCWSTSPNPTLDDAHTTDGSGSGDFTSTLTGLAPGTTYYVRAYATSIGTTYGNEVTFTTLPIVSTNAVSDITLSEAIGGGVVNYDVNSNIVARGVCWSESHNPTLNDNHTNDGSGVGSFTSAISGLQPGTTYYVRAYATTNTGTIYGNEVSFTTAVFPAGDALPCPGTPTVTDYDGNIYNTVKVGGQCWMKENLRTTHYSDGTPVTPLYAPNNDTSLVSSLGYFYKWNSVMNGSASSDAIPSGVQGICPIGWHVPSPWELYTLQTYAGNEPAHRFGNSTTNAAKALCDTMGWMYSGGTCDIGNDPGSNNSTGFSAYPAGGFNGSEYVDFGESARFWSTRANGDFSLYYILAYNQTQLFGNNDPNSYGCSVRCLRDVVTAHIENVTDVTYKSAVCTVEVIYHGYNTVTTRGICWSTSPNPTIDGSHTENGSGTGLFVAPMTLLDDSTTYYVRAYASTSDGVVYGNEVSFTTPLAGVRCPGEPTVTDVDGNIYNTVQIGTQCWMKENLRTTHYSSGDLIPYGDERSTTLPYRNYPNNDSSLVPVYGYLYNWSGMMNGSASTSSVPSNVQGACPDGWHVPSHAEWMTLINYSREIDPNHDARPLSNVVGWDYSSNPDDVGGSPQENNSTGFSSLPAGAYDLGGYGGFFGCGADYWAATEDTYWNNSYAIHYGISCNRSYVYIYDYAPVTGLFRKDVCISVRCLRDVLCASVSSEFFDTACESYTWRDSVYTQSGDYTQTFVNANGCDSVVTLHLTVNYGTHDVETETACESFTWHGETYTQSGTYTHAYTNNDGCASVDTLKLTVNYGTHNVVTETACENFTWHGHTYTSSGTYTHAYTNTNGCASVDTLKLTVNYGTHNVITETACESFSWHGNTYTQSGTFTHAYTNADGCASVDTLKLTVNYGTHNVVTETACESHTWHG